MPHKRCTKCGIIKDLNDFPPHNKTKDRRQSRCRSCINIAKEKIRRDKGQLTRAEWKEKISTEKEKRKPQNIQRRKRNKLKYLNWLLEGNVTKIQLIDIYVRDKGRCVYCGCPVEPRFAPFNLRGFDHINARANGGKHTANNIVTCCRKCNELKGTTPWPNGLRD